MLSGVMVSKMVVALVLTLGGVEPGALKVLVKAPSDVSGVVVRVDGDIVAPGVVYTTGPLVIEKTVVVELRWVEGGVEKTRSMPVTLRPGYMVVVTMSVPRDWISLTREGT
jgi:hypothetical protein